MAGVSLTMAAAGEAAVCMAYDCVGTAGGTLYDGAITFCGNVGLERLGRGVGAGTVPSMVGGGTVGIVKPEVPATKHKYLYASINGCVED